MKDNEILLNISTFLADNENKKITHAKLREFVANILTKKSEGSYYLPSTGFLRLKDIIGDRNASPPIPAILPISRTTWWEGVEEGKYPAPLFIGYRTAVWPIEEIFALIQKIKEEAPRGRARDGTL